MIDKEKLESLYKLKGEVTTIIEIKQSELKNINKQLSDLIYGKPVEPKEEEVKPEEK